MRVLLFLVLMILLRAEPTDASSPVEHIWSDEQSRYLVLDELVVALNAPDIILIEEQQNRLSHFKRAGWLFRNLTVERSLPMVLALEILRPEQMAHVRRFRQRSPEDATHMGKYLQWTFSGWASWKTYLPLFQAAFQARAPIMAVDLSTSKQMPYRNGSTPPDIQSDEVYYWARKISEVHCGLVTPEFERMRMHLQIMRSRTMMQQVYEKAATMPVLLVANHTHIERLARLLKASEYSVAVLSFVAPDHGPDHPYADYVWEVQGETPVNLCAEVQSGQ